MNPQPSLRSMAVSPVEMLLFPLTLLGWSDAVEFEVHPASRMGRTRGIDFPVSKIRSAPGTPHQKSNIDTKNWPCLKGATFSKPSIWVQYPCYIVLRGCKTKRKKYQTWWHVAHQLPWNPKGL